MKTFLPPVLFAVCVCGMTAARAAVIPVRGTDSAAIAAAVARSAPGDTIRLPAGVYTLTTAVRPRSRTRLLGAGVDRTVLRFAGKEPASLIHLEGCEDVEVAGMTLDGAGNPQARQGVSAHDSRRLRLHHLRIRNLVKGEGFGPHGIYFTGVDPTREKGVTDSEIADCRLEDIGVGAAYGGGIRLNWGSARNRVLRCTIRNTGRGGIFGGNGATDLIIRENTVAGSGGEGLGIEVWGGCERAVIEDNRVDHWISIDNSSYSAVRRNVVRARSGAPKLAGLELVASSFCVFTDNVVDGGQQIGISVSNQPEKNYVYWGYNRIADCAQWGAQIQGDAGGAAYHYFYRCTFDQMSVGPDKAAYPGDEGHGFRTNSNARHLTLEECAFRDNGRLGLQLGGAAVDSLSFVRCTISGNRGAAVSGPGSYTALEWVDCRVGNNGSDALPAAKPFPRAAPMASLSFPATARVGEAVRFRSVSRAAGGGKIARVLWDFNDGIPSTDETATHIFGKAGSYRVTLLVWDDAGRGARAEKRILISAAQPARRRTR